jgi:hypothetical protein
MTRLAALALALALAAPQVQADTVCRPNSLGSESCTGPATRPLPRPDRIRIEVQALDRMIRPPDAGQPPQVFVPSARRSVLGSTLADQPGLNLCRPNALGNLRCR